MYKIKKENPTTFRISDNEQYWIGATSKGEEFWFDGDKETIEYIKTCNWRKRTDGYFQNYKGERLHRVVLKITNSKIVVDHINNEKYDNRFNNLRKVTKKENNKNKNTYNKFGVVGLSMTNNKYVGTLRINDINIRINTYEEKNEAIIDLLIAQKHYNYKHNENLYYLLEDIKEDRVKKVIDIIEYKLKNYKPKENRLKNEYILSEDKKYYIVLCNKIDSYDNFKISIKDKDKIDKYYWSISKTFGGKYYVRSTIINSQLHRFLFDLQEEKYSDFYIDHLNGDSLDNRIKNLVITDKKGNNTNIKGKGYYKVKDKYRASISVGEYNTKKSKMFSTEEEARMWYLNEKEKEIKNRNIWSNKEQLDAYIEQSKIS